MSHRLLPRLAALFAFALVIAAPPARAGGFDDPALVARLLPSVVAIDTSTPGPDGGAPAIDHASGFVIDPSGVILTSGHVADNIRAPGDSITVTLNDGTVLRAQVLFRAPIDLALLQVHAGRKLPPVHWGDSDRARPGSGVIAIGNPLGIGISVSTGIVSALGRDIQDTPFDAFLQTDAALNQGNSGGPIFDLKGEVIGVATGLITPKGQSGSIGLGLAIPARDAQFVVDSFRQYGRVRAGWLGARLAAVTPGIADSLELPQAGGAVVTGVPRGTPAAAAGLRVGDVILRDETGPIASPKALNRRFEMAAVGDHVRLSLLRDATPVQADVVVGDAPEPAAAPAAAPLPPPAPHPGLGLQLAPLDAAGRKRLGLSAGAAGVLVTQVAPGSTAAGHGLRAGDVIARVQWSAVARPEDVRAAVESARGTGRQHVLLGLRKRGGLRLVTLPLGTEP